MTFKPESCIQYRYGDEIGSLNDRDFLTVESKAHDNRWMHRPRIDWDDAELRKQHSSVQQRIFEGLRKIIAVRKSTPAFADYNDRELLETKNPHLFAFMRTNPFLQRDHVLVIANFDSTPQSLNLGELPLRGSFEFGGLQDLYSGGSPNLFNGQLVVPPHQFYCLKDQGQR